MSNNKLRRGIYYLSIEKSVNGLISIGLIPVIISTLGIDLFGLWGILLGIFGYLQCCDIGVSFSLERYIAFYEAKKDRVALQNIVTTSLTYLLVLCILILIIIIVFGESFIELFTKGISVAIPENLLLHCYPAIAISILLFVLTSIPRGFQLFHISSKIQIAGKAVFAVSLLIFLHLKPDINALIGAYTLQNITLFLLYFIASKIIAPKIRFFRVGVSINLLKMMMNFGYKVQVSLLSSLVMLHFDKMLLSYFYGLAYAGYYEAATRIIFAIRDVPLFLMSVLMPRISELSSQNKITEISNIYLKITRQLAIVSFILLIFLLALEKSILTFLLKSEPTAFTQLVFTVLCIPCFWHVVSAGASYTARGMGKTSIEMVTSILSLFLNVLFSLVLLKFFAYNGVVFGTAVAMTISPIACYYLVNKELKLSLTRFMVVTFKHPVIYVIFMVLLIKLSQPAINAHLNWIMAALCMVLPLLIATHIYYILIKDNDYRELIDNLFSSISKKNN